MHKRIQEIQEAIHKFHATSKEDVAGFYKQFLGKKGVVTKCISKLKKLKELQEKRILGQKLNVLKNITQDRLRELEQQFIPSSTASKVNIEDITLPPHSTPVGSIHPITQMRHLITTLFEHIGFSISEGPEIEDDWHNFTALNFPPNHPSRYMQDTFFVNGHDHLLRTHTSSVQVRVMTSGQPPIRIVSSGRTFRNEAISSRSHCMFHQIEGLYVDRDVTFLDLKDTLWYLIQALFGVETKIRFRPSYFPFTEPSAEIDIDCRICLGVGCNVCKYTGWVELGGAGMVDPAVLTNCKIDPLKYTGFAFGMGIERMAMLLYRINDVRMFTQNDVRFLDQFTGI